MTRSRIDLNTLGVRNFIPYSLITLASCRSQYSARGQIQDGGVPRLSLLEEARHSARGQIQDGGVLRRPRATQARQIPLGARFRTVGYEP